MILNGDCLEELKKMEEFSVDALVTDPPAGISFMGKEWDGDKGGRLGWIAWMTEVMKECHRVMKPGAHGLIWALPRTSHWTATALEDAGFQVRDVITHLFGSGFPKSLNVGKKVPEYEGWGTALKPASEHWILVRKPLSEPTVEKNVRKWGLGGININASRIESKPRKTGTVTSGDDPTGSGSTMSGSSRSKQIEYDLKNQGRFPANLILDEEAGAMLDEQSGLLKTNPGKISSTLKDNIGYGGFTRIAQEIKSDSGGASRFFYCAKVSASERGEGNKHPTVKAQKLMRYLIKMITPPEGIVLDPFMGSGSTGLAAKSEGFQFIGIEREAEYFEIAEKRIQS